MMCGLTTLIVATTFVGTLHAEVVDTPKQYLLPKATKLIKVDGKLDEWDMAKTPYVISLSPQHPMCKVFSVQPRGDKDISSRVALAWDERYLYVAAAVTDDQLRGVRPDSVGNQGPAGWFCDSLIVVMHSSRQPLKLNNPQAPHVAMALRYAPTGSKPRGTFVGRTYPTTIDQTDMYWKLPRGSLWKVRETPEGYSLEVAVPWKELGLTPRVGERFFMAFLQVDVDPGDPLHQIGWGFNPEGNESAWPVFRLSGGAPALGILTAAADEVAVNEDWSVRVEMDAITAPARLRAIRVVDAAGKAVVHRAVTLTVPKGKTGTMVQSFRAGQIATAGSYMIEALAGDDEPAVLARVPVRITPPANAPELPNEVRPLLPARITVNAVEEHRRGFFRHNFITGRDGYVPYIRKHAAEGVSVPESLRQ